MSDDAYDVAAEQSLLGAVLANPAVAGPVLASVPVSAWWNPRHADIATVLADRFRSGQPIDPLLVLPDLRARCGFTDGRYLITLMEHAWVPTNADAYAHRVLRCAARRNLSAACTRSRQLLQQSWVNGWDEPVGTFTGELRAACDAAETADAGMDLDGPSEPVGSLLDEPEVYNWLVPGLLEKAERILLTGGEGHGKSTLSRQFGVALAAGLHPFTGNRLGRDAAGLSVLVVDMENSRSQARRGYRRIAQGVDRAAGADWRTNLRVEFRPGGIDLLGVDRPWLERKVAANAPDLLVIGPLYKMCRGASLNDEVVAATLASTLDGLRERYGCALLTEAHAGHDKDPAGRRAWRPRGSSLLLGWPEFGFGLCRAKDQEDEHPRLVDVVSWRGSREERQWPRQLKWGSVLPWEPAELDYWELAG